MTIKRYACDEGFPIAFEDQGGKTKMTLKYPTTEVINFTMLDNMKQGWNQSFDKLAESLE
ncbi:MAG: SRPBCC domain-containing protein [Nitrosotalea sp.]